MRETEQVWGIWVDNPRHVSGWVGLVIGRKFRPFCWDKAYADERLSHMLATTEPSPSAHVAVVPETQREGWEHGIQEGSPVAGITLGSLA